MTFARIFQDLSSHTETMSFDNHLDNDRGITNELVNFSEDFDAAANTNIKRTVHSDWGEAVLGWKNITPSPTYLPTGVPSLNLKRRSTKYDWQRQTASDDADIDSKICVKCVNDDFDPLPIAAWKANVEQGTYRYVANNGYYRTTKFLEQSPNREWFTVNKKTPEKVSMTWQNKRFKKDLKRQLKREFHSRDCKSESAIADMCKPESLDSDRTHQKKEKKARVKSVQSEALQPSVPLTDSDKDNDKMLPDLRNIPLNLYKSSSDLYIDNISTRINALEKELKRDSQIRRPPQEGQESVRSILSYKPQCNKDKEKEYVNASPRSKKEVGHGQSDMMTIKPIGSKNDLKPIEKVTPAQRFISTDSKKMKPLPHHIKYTNSRGSDAANLSAPSIPTQIGIGTSDLEKALNSYKLAIESTKQSLFHTLTAAKIPRRGAGSKNFGTTAAIAFCDTLSSNIDIDRNTKENVQSAPTGKHQSDQEKNAALAGLLPEIAGKRLEVVTTTNRWL